MSSKPNSDNRVDQALSRVIPRTVNSVEGEATGKQTLCYAQSGRVLHKTSPVKGKLDKGKPCREREANPAEGNPCGKQAL